MARFPVCKLSELSARVDVRVDVATLVCSGDEGCGVRLSSKSLALCRLVHS